VAEEIGRTYAPTIPLWGDAKAGIADLGAAIAEHDEPPAGRVTWCDQVIKRMGEWREMARERLESDETPVSMGRLMGELNKVLPDDAILIADGGFAAHWGGLLYDTKRPGRGFVPDRGFASIGYGLPGAIGATLAAPDRPVFALTGDGGFNMVLGELETARRLGLAFTIIVVNNAASGYVKALAASDVRGGGLPVERPRRDELCRGRRGAGLPRHSRRGAGRARRRACARRSRSAGARQSSTSSSPATRPRCCPPPTTAR
jgi:acetolactate synthase I/II/III large subunit